MHSNDRYGNHEYGYMEPADTALHMTGAEQMPSHLTPVAMLIPRELPGSGTVMNAVKKVNTCLESDRLSSSTILPDPT